MLRTYLSKYYDGFEIEIHTQKKMIQGHLNHLP